jgi:hypothetical protein
MEDEEHLNRLRLASATSTRSGESTQTGATLRLAGVGPLDPGDGHLGGALMQAINPA